MKLRHIKQFFFYSLLAVLFLGFDVAGRTEEQLSRLNNAADRISSYHNDFDGYSDIYSRVN